MPPGDQPHGPGDRNRQRRPSRGGGCDLMVAAPVVAFIAGYKFAKLWATRSK